MTSKNNISIVFSLIYYSSSIMGDNTYIVWIFSFQKQDLYFIYIYSNNSHEVRAIIELASTYKLLHITFLI